MLTVIFYGFLMYLTAVIAGQSDIIRATAMILGGMAGFVDELKKIRRMR